MTKLLILLIFSIILNHCSFDTRSGIWTQEKKIDEIEEKKIDTKKLFKKINVNNEELNPDLRIELINNFGFNEFKVEKISKYKFKKIKYFDQFEPELVFYNEDVIFFDKNGSIIRFDDNSNIIWKVNYYSKREKKIRPILKISKYKDKLLITDSLAQFYLIEINSGELIWKSDHETTFVSEIKIDKDMFYALDANNSFNSFSLENGKKVWSFNSEKVLINSQKQTPIILNDNLVTFINSKSEMITLDKKSGDLIWLTSTITFNETFQSYLIKNSNLSLENKNIYFSNNNNKFFSVNSEKGFINWTQNINSSLKPFIINDFVLTVSTNGYLYIINKNSGEIIRITNILKGFKFKKRKTININGFVVAKKQMYISTNKGHLIVVNLENGLEEKVFRISRDNLSKPYINNDRLYLIKDDSIIKLK